MLDKFGYTEVGMPPSRKHERLMSYAGGGKLTAARRQVLARVSQHGSTDEKSWVRSAVRQKSPASGGQQPPK